MTEDRIDFETRAGVEALIERFGGLRPCAVQLNLAVGTVQGWKKRGSVPVIHQQRIRALLEQKGAGLEPALPAAAQEAVREKEGAFFEQEGAQKKEGAGVGAAAKESEESIVSAFTSSVDFGSNTDGLSGDSSSSGGEGGLDISSEVWEHAALPRSTSGQWAILISLIALVGVLTRPLWSERIDAKMMGILGDGHSTEAEHESQDEHDSTSEAETGADSSAAVESSAAGTGVALVLPPDVLARLQRLERDLEALNAQQSTPASTELRRMKSESDALVAAFDNQAARLDSLSELLRRRATSLSQLRAQVESLEQNRATEHLSRRLSALFQLENIAYAIAQQSGFSLNPLKKSLSLEEREQLEDALALLHQAQDISSPQQLLADYRRLLPDLLSWHAARALEQSGEEQGFVARFAQRLRAQLFSVFSLRRRYGNEKNVLFIVERMLEDGRWEQAEERLSQTSPSGKTARNSARNRLGNEAFAQLEAFRAALSLRNKVFAALREVRSVLSQKEADSVLPR